MGTIKGIQAIQWAKEISKLPEGTFTIAFYPYSRQCGVASNELTIKHGCKFRPQLPDERFSIDRDNLFLFTDGDGNPRMCYRILMRFIGFPNDNFNLHNIEWL
ncbi:MAG: hypothetical protein LIP08_02925 [Bacteroides sp.]|nr:hypothetical protein [Bacteroides sp.]